MLPIWPLRKLTSLKGTFLTEGHQSRAMSEICLFTLLTGKSNDLGGTMPSLSMWEDYARTCVAEVTRTGCTYFSRLPP